MKATCQRQCPSGLKIEKHKKYFNLFARWHQHVWFMRLGVSADGVSVVESLKIVFLMGTSYSVVHFCCRMYRSAAYIGNSPSWDLNGASPNLHNSLEYLQVITQHLSVVMVTVKHDEVQHTTH